LLRAVNFFSGISTRIAHLDLRESEVVHIWKMLSRPATHRSCWSSSFSLKTALNDVLSSAGLLRVLSHQYDELKRLELNAVTDP